MKRAIRWLLGGLLVLAGLTLLFGRETIAQRLFDRALDRNVGIDQSAKLGDGLHAYVCGSGSPMPDADRAGPCIAVLAGQQAFIFDSGSGSIRKLGRMGFPMGKLRAEFLTHLHSDHIDGLGEALLQAWVAGHRAAPLPVYGPPGTDQVVAGFNQAYAIDSTYRIAHHGPKVVQPSGFGGAASIITLPEGTDSQVVYEKEGVRITAIRVNHAPISPAYGYRIDYKGRSIALSGDTVYSPSFVSAAKGADVMFHEALNKKMVAALGAKLAERGQANNAQIMSDIQNYHASPEDAARAAREAGVNTLVLYHLVPPVPARLIEPLFLGDAPKEFSGTLRLGHDGMIVSLPAGGKQVKFSEGW
ncbi:MAG: MBL fold metallo-hydrolase [Novosphingobium sp.]|uniref:MBL fold metallo-hydrolase n=1 Tax=Novosphingobium sp. TaxID=1874826 RepID=UPI00261C4153|nr:MBL fold metallo-hydrolase [Novosphingobium sp.]MCP5386945.1 MBL fold metallo-hydrolase [Novosphingobium sp.]